MDGYMDIIDELSAVMQKEIDQLGKYVSVGESIMKNLMDKDWENLQVHLTLSGTLSQNIEATEAERNRIYGSLKSSCAASENANFYQVVSVLEPESRKNLTEQFRALKLVLLQAQGISWKIEAYVSSAGSTMKELMNRIFPHRKGTLYSRNGIVREAENNPMVLNRKL